MAGPVAMRPDGSMGLLLGTVEVDAIARTCEEVIAAVGGEPDPGTERLFPQAFPDDPTAQADYEQMTRDEHTAGIIRNARAVLASIEAGDRKRSRWAGTLDPEQQEAWITTINAARLMLGTRLGVDEEMDHEPKPASDPSAPAHNLYLYLSGLLELLTEALLERLGTDE